MISIPEYDDLKALFDAQTVKLDALLQRFSTMSESLDFLMAQTDIIRSRLEATMATLDDVRNAVASENTVIDSAIALLNGITQQLSDLLATGATPDALQALINDIDSKKTELANAVAANTPNQPPPA